MCRAANPAEAPYCIVCGERLPDRATRVFIRPKARPDLPIALAILAIGVLLLKIKSLSTDVAVWDVVVVLLPAAIYGGIFLVSPLQDRLVDPWLLQVLALVVGGFALFGAFMVVYH
jgi:hypothetical protein